MIKSSEMSFKYKRLLFVSKILDKLLEHFEIEIYEEESRLRNIIQRNNRPHRVASYIVVKGEIDGY
jgi:hypothetical protein